MYHINRFSKTVISILIFNVILITLCIFSGWRREAPAYYFEERSTVTFFSALLLSISAFTSFILSFIEYKRQKKPKCFNFWILSGIGFVYLCLDEYFMIHEGMDEGLVEFFGGNPNLANFDGLIIGALGLIGVGCLARFWQDLVKLKDFFILICIALSLFVVMLFFDQMGGHDHISMIIEETFKILSVSFFVGAYVTALFSVLSDTIGEEYSE